MWDEGILARLCFGHQFEETRTMKTPSQEDLESLRDRKEEWLTKLGVEATSIGLDRGGNVCLRLWCPKVTPELRRSILEDDELSQVPLDFEEGTDFVTQ
jgi:hypothetical protein